MRIPCVGLVAAAFAMSVSMRAHAQTRAPVELWTDAADERLQLIDDAGTVVARCVGPCRTQAEPGTYEARTLSGSDLRVRLVGVPEGGTRIRVRHASRGGAQALWAIGAAVSGVAMVFLPFGLFATSFGSRDDQVGIVAGVTSTIGGIGSATFVAGFILNAAQDGHVVGPVRVTPVVGDRSVGLAVTF